MTSKPTLGYLGLGLMGSQMCKRLVENGYQVTGFDPQSEKVDAAVAHGALAADSPRAVAQASDIVLACVITTPALTEAMFGPDGIVEGAAEGKIFLDHSTTIADKTRDMAARLKSETGMGWVDAPVSGGPPAAGTGGLAIMVGGDKSDVTAVKPVLDILGQNTHMGPLGAGQVTKMVNQVLVLNNFALMAEAVTLAINAGIDPAMVPEALSGGYADSPMFRKFFPKMIERDFEPAGYARQIMKDLDMILDLAQQTKTPVPMSNTAASLYRVLIAKGHSELDAISVLKVYDNEPM
ncbi:MAG: NAD(P)-dependent oxidoreductase [Alphaproteobacteria bacterium]|nr:NAD(P)-dependent oxidoreductase [Alphaproteobacteria bacterium]MBT4019418.1 NAD(P)-dependent oxidoreductase [Alphaproteobacteria bacterium]MBT4965950.1 NAD(P)-dependent oxidoreductase [Alphaproteobacteria bacterium]MBT5159399.1 NAD(P)-dependent oxidoreductase [Alphaproteobacteria bacterium]MBT5920141.1 NAD(P)-dependent oxidoreductase [Alphaproteobacteria bacterium]